MIGSPEREAANLAWMTYLEAIAPTKKAYHDAMNKAWNIYQKTISELQYQQEKGFEEWKRKREEKT